MFGIKKQLTVDQFAEILYYFAKKFSFDYVSQEVNKENSPFKDTDENVFCHERLIMIFWIIDKFFADKERKITAAIHKQYFTDINILNNKEAAKEEISFIMNRYKEYYDVYNNENELEQHLLAGTVAKNIFQKEKTITNFIITSDISLDIMLLINQLKKSIFDKYKLR